MNLQERLDIAKDHATAGGVPVRRKDGALYRLLAECLAICEHVQHNGLEAELRAAVRVSVDVRTPEIWAQGRPRSDGNAGKGKRYAERGSSATLLVCRYVLGGDARNNPYRYAICLREAERRQVGSAGLVDWLIENGGLNTLYRGRPLTAVRRVVRTLHLNNPLTVPVSGAFTVVLKRDHRGYFTVIQSPDTGTTAVQPHTDTQVGTKEEGMLQ